MTADVAIDLFRRTLTTALLLSGPMLVTGLIVGLVISIFQAATQIHEMTVSFVPKIVLVVAVLVVLLPWMTGVMPEFSASLLGNLGRYGR
jgi:flagellar biosynthetic protein FliQ